jgi:mannose-6-phosphate isomerase-like protein (cupin superfamily)
MKKGYKDNIEKLTLENNDFRKVLYTGLHMQLVLMSLKPLEDIGLETHNENDQFFRFEKGEGKVIVNDTEYLVSDGDTVIIPSGAKHNIINLSGKEDLKMYTIYAPAHHKDGIIRNTKEEAESNPEDFDGITTE